MLPNVQLPKKPLEHLFSTAASIADMLYRSAHKAYFGQFLAKVVQEDANSLLHCSQAVEFSVRLPGRPQGQQP